MLLKGNILKYRVEKLKNNLLLHCLIILNDIILFFKRSVLAMSYHFKYLIVNRYNRQHGVQKKLIKYLPINENT